MTASRPRLVVVATLACLACGERSPGGPGLATPPRPDAPPRTLAAYENTLYAIEGGAVLSRPVEWPDLDASGARAIELPDLAGSRSIVADAFIVCGLSDAGVVVCLSPLDGLPRAAEIGSYGQGISIIDRDGTLWVRSREPASRPVATGTHEVSRLGGHGGLVCGVRPDGQVRCSSAGSPATVAPLDLPLTDVVALSHDDELCAVHRDGHVSCPVLAAGLEVRLDRFEVVEGLARIVEVAAGYSTVCGRTDGGVTRCAARRADGLGVRMPPQDVIDDAVELAIGPGMLTCARRRGGDVVCWSTQDTRALPRVGETLPPRFVPAVVSFARER